MKKIILACFAIVVMLAGCKTTEANYKSAYETAKEKNAAWGYRFGACCRRQS